MTGGGGDGQLLTIINRDSFHHPAQSAMYEKENIRATSAPGTAPRSTVRAHLAQYQCYGPEWEGRLKVCLLKNS